MSLTECIVANDINGFITLINSDIEINPNLLLNVIGNERSEMALELIKSGKSNPAYISIHGFTPFMAACINEMTDVAIALLKTENAIPKFKNIITGQDAFGYIVDNKMIEVAVEMIKMNIFSMEDFEPYFVGLTKSFFDEHPIDVLEIDI